MFLLPVIAAQAGLNLLLQADFLLLSNAAGKHARLVGLDDREADKLLAPYRAAQLFGFLPFQLLMSVQFVLFPLLAKAHGEGDREAVVRLTRSGVRTALVLTGLIAGTVASVSPHLLRFAFPQNIAEGGVPFVRFYVLGLSSLAIVGVASAALAGLRKERWSMALTWISVGAVAVAILATRKSDAFGPELLQSTAFATAGAMTTAAVIGAALLRRAAGGFVAPLTFLRVVVAVAITVTVGSFIPYKGKLLAPIFAGMMALLYLGTLIVLRELGNKDLDLVKNVIARRRKT